MGGFKPCRGGITDASEGNYEAFCCNEMGVHQLFGLSTSLPLFGDNLQERPCGGADNHAFFIMACQNSVVSHDLAELASLISMPNKPTACFSILKTQQAGT